MKFLASIQIVFGMIFISLDTCYSFQIPLTTRPSFPATRSTTVASRQKDDKIHSSTSKTFPNNICTRSVPDAVLYHRKSTELHSHYASSIVPIVWVLTSILGGTSGTPFVIESTQTWYTTISLPSFTPPNKIFAPVWTVLYTLMGIASWRIRQTIISMQSSSNPILSFLQCNIIPFSFIHYIMNISWAPIFFGLKRLRMGHVLNVLLLVTLIPIIGIYLSIDVWSGVLLLPYLLWLGLATRLSSEVCKLNPTEVKLGYWCNNAKLQDQIWKLRKEAGKRVDLES